MAFNKTVVVFSTILCCAVAFPDFIFPTLKVQKGSRIKRELQPQTRPELSVDQKCDRMSSAYQNLVSVIYKYVPANQIEYIRDQVMQTTGMDIMNRDHIDEEACQLAAVSNIAELAAHVGIDVDEMREMYPSVVESIQMIRSLLRDLVTDSYMPAQSKALFNACLRLYDVMEEIGLYELE